MWNNKNSIDLNRYTSTKGLKDPGSIGESIFETVYNSIRYLGFYFYRVNIYTNRKDTD